MVKTLALPALIGILVSAQAKLSQQNFSVSDLTASSFLGGWNIDGSKSTFEADGIKHVVPGADTVGADNAWNFNSYVPFVGNDITKDIAKNFSLKDNETIDFEFSIDFYDEDGNLKVGTKNGTQCVDIYAIDLSKGNTLAILRIWVDAWGTKNGSHSYALYDGSWNALPSTGKAIKGDALASSSFSISFDKENLFSSIAPDSDGKFVPFVNNDGSDIFNSTKAAVVDANYIGFKIGGDGGWAKEANVVLKEINGQSLASTDGQIEDNVAPRFDSFSFPSTLQIDETANLEITAHDVLSSNISYSIQYGETKVDGLSFTPTKEGEDSVTIFAKDESGNEASKTFTFQGVNIINVPTFEGSLPTIESKTYDYFDTIVVDKPTIVDSTGLATIEMKYRLESQEEYKTVSLNSNDQFVIDVDENLTSGNYDYYFVATNKGGSTESTHQSVTINRTEYTSVDFVDQGDAKALVQYESKGIKIRTKEMHKDISLGEFMLDDGMDVEYHVPFINTQGKTNGAVSSAGYVDFKLVNAQNSDYWIAYRVWTDTTTDNHDCPTTVRIGTPEENTKIIDNTGWISYGDNSNYKDLKLKFTMSDFFESIDHTGNRRVAEVDGQTTTSDAMNAFFASAPRGRYKLTFSTGDVNLSYGSISANVFETTIASINGQDFANNNGVMNHYNDVTVKISGEEKVEIGDEKTFGVYFKDIFTKDIDLVQSVKMVKPDQSEETITLENGEFKYTFDTIGKYKLVAKATGKSGKEVAKELNIEATQKKIPTTITLKGEYQATASIGDEITILDADYSSNVNPDKCTITVIDMEQNETSVKAGDKYKFSKPGVYTIRYFASDDATPEANTATVDYNINVADTKKPVVSFSVNESYTLNETVTFKVDASDDTAMTYAITLTKPDGNKSKFTEAEFQVKLDQVGKYSIQVKVTDLYDNEETVVKEFNVIEGKKEDNNDGGNNVPAIVGGVIGGVAGVALISAAIVIVIKKRKAK